MPLRLFHKEIEAYLCAEGLFDESVAEDGELHFWLPFVLNVSDLSGDKDFWLNVFYFYF